jgi:Domain of Unknown Function (DUF1206)
MADAAAQLTILTRLGFATRGLIYLAISYLILSTGRAEDPQGALEYLGQGGGRVILGMMTLGSLAYGIWRLSDAVFDIERHGSDKAGRRGGQRDCSLAAGVAGDQADSRNWRNR